MIKLLQHYANFNQLLFHHNVDHIVGNQLHPNPAAKPLCTLDKGSIQTFAGNILYFLEEHSVWCVPCCVVSVPPAESCGDESLEEPTVRTVGGL